MRSAIKKETKNHESSLNSIDGVISYASIHQNKAFNAEKTNRERLFSLGKIYDKNRKNKAIKTGIVNISTGVKVLAWLIGKIVSFLKNLSAGVSIQTKKIGRNKIARNVFIFLKRRYAKLWRNKAVLKMSQATKFLRNKISAVSAPVRRRFSVAVRPLQEKLKELGLLKFSSVFRRMTQKTNFRRLHLQIIIFTTLILAITGFVFFRETKVGAYTYAWVQTEWDAAATSTSTTSHDASQNGRTDNTGYQAKDANIQINNPAPSDSQVTISTVNGTPWTEASSSDFNAGLEATLMSAETPFLFKKITEFPVGAMRNAPPEIAARIFPAGHIATPRLQVAWILLWEVHGSR